MKKKVFQHFRSFIFVDLLDDLKTLGENKINVYK